MLALPERFPGAELVLDGMTPFVIGLKNLQLALRRAEFRVHWGLKSPKILEAWHPGIRLLDQ